jgi:hypothetical protein
MKKNKHSFESGQSLFELLVAIGISALIIVVLVSLVSNALQNATFARNMTLSGRYAQEATEWLRTQRDVSTDTFITNVSSQIGVARCFNNLDWNGIGGCGTSTITGTQFIRQITFSSKDTVVDGETKTIIEADIVVFWTDSKGYHETRSATDFSDWRQS